MFSDLYQLTFGTLVTLVRWALEFAYGFTLWAVSAAFFAAIFVPVVVWLGGPWAFAVALAAFAGAVAAGPVFNRPGPRVVQHPHVGQPLGNEAAGAGE